jgi:phosphoesterase RecJ-like protein
MNNPSTLHFSMKPIEEILPLLAHPRKIVITHHYNPDADALGSTLALYHYLTVKGHSCTVISPNSMPDFLLWMPDADKVMIYDQQIAQSNEVIKESEILFCLDFNQVSRTKVMTQVLNDYAGIKVMIDHHLFPDLSFEYGISIPEKSSTCEMVYDFINASGDNQLITKMMAQCIYAGTMTDTGSFKFSCTSSETHRMVADLMDKGLVPAPVHQAVFDNYQENRLRFLGYVLSEKMMIFPNQHTALIAISREELNRYKINTGDSEGIVNFPLSIKNIIFSIFISERESEIRMSFRSKGNLDVNEFARKYFNGGGHANAAGGKSDDSLSETIEKIKNALNENESLFKTCYQESLLS